MSSPSKNYDPTTCEECGFSEIGCICGYNEDTDPDLDYHRTGCVFPGRCLMPGEHMMDECHTIADVEAWAEEMAEADPAPPKERP